MWKRGTAGAEEITKEQIKEALEAVLEFSAAFDLDEVDSVMKQLEGYKMPETFEKTDQELKAAEQIVESIDNFFEKNKAKN